MPLKPVTEYVGGKGPRQHIWEAIRRLAAKGLAFNERQIWAEIPAQARITIELDTVRDYRRALVAAKILTQATPPEHHRIPATFRLLADEGIEAPRLRRDGSRVTMGLSQEQMWRTLRMLSADINAVELAAHASTPAVPVDRVAANDYLLTLNTAGYLICTKEGKGRGNGGTLARYRIKPTRNTGPRPPMVCRTRVVYDPNEDKVVWTPAINDEDAIYGKR